MSVAAQYAIAVGVVFGANLLPAFGPPTWALPVFFSLDFDLPATPLIDHEETESGTVRGKGRADREPLGEAVDEKHEEDRS
jgi:hypothetical protein